MYIYMNYEGESNGNRKSATYIRIESKNSIVKKELNEVII